MIWYRNILNDVFFICYNNSNVRSQPARQQPMTQTIQIPASMAGHQLVALQMPDGRQQIFALQGNQTLQMIQTPAGLQQVITWK